MISSPGNDVTSTSIRFDAYTATLSGPKPGELLGLLVNPGSDRISQGKGFHTFGERISVKDESGTECGSISWGGHQGERLMFEVKGARSPKAVERLRSAFPHRVTRVDSCADFDAPGSFQRLLGPCTQIKKDHRLRGEKKGDWEDFPEFGRTFHLGAPSSPVQCRLYEKGLTKEYLHLKKPDWVRLEVQARPCKEAKQIFSTLSPLEVWGASRWSRELAGLVLEQHVSPHPVGTVYKLSDRERALRWMCKQYGAHLVSLAGDLGGFECLGLTLREMIAEASTEEDLSGLPDVSEAKLNPN
jgi:hypothetical protein